MKNGLIERRLVSVEDMIKEVDVDGDGRIDFYGKFLFSSSFNLSFQYRKGTFILRAPVQRNKREKEKVPVCIKISIS